MKSVRAAAAAALVLVLALTFWGCSKPSPQKQVENGLLPLVPIKGWPAWSLEERMKEYGVPGVSIAVFDNFEIVWAAGYGVAAGSEPVSAETLFQAGNLSSLVTTVAALEQVGAGKLGLDTPIDGALRSWQLPPSQLADAQPLTLRLLLSNAAGLSVEQLMGYEADDTPPTLAQMLRGELPANTPEVRPLRPAGRQYPPTPGGYLVVEQALEDVTGQPFAELAGATVLTPLGMSASTFAQPLPPDRLAGAASGHLASGAPVPGKARVYPELAATGLWTTPSDYAKLLIEVAHAAQGSPGQVLPGALGVEILKPVAGAAAPGTLVSFQGGVPHMIGAGITQGFFGRFVAYPERGAGAVVLTNSDNGRLLALEIFQAIGRAYGWQGYVPDDVAPIQLKAEQLDGLAGRYALGLDSAMAVRRRGDHLEMREPLALGGSFWAALVPISETTFTNVATGQPIAFKVDRRGRATAYSFQGPNGQEVDLPRLEDDAPPTARELLEAGRVEDAIAAYRQLERIGEQRINLAGYALIGQGKLDAAVAVLELNAERHPQSANVFDSLADVYLARGDREKALAAVRKEQENLALDTTTDPALLQVIKGKVNYLLQRLGG